MGSQKKQSAVVEQLVRELRQGHGLGASFFRAAAAQAEMTDTDMQVIDILETTGEATAGELASLMALSTGTFTAILKRLENAGLVRRERDPNDGRRVIVKLATGADSKPDIALLFASLSDVWAELAAQYDDEQKAVLLDFLQRSNALAREEIALMREEPVSSEGISAAPLGSLEHAQLVISSDTFGLNLRAEDLSDALYHARFEGPVPDVKVKEGVVTIRYPRRLWLPGLKKRAAEVTLSVAIPWQIVLQGGASEITAELGNLNLVSLELKGGAHSARLELPAPAGVVPVRISGGASETTIRRPAGTAARVHLKGWASEFVFDDQTFSAVGNDVRLQSQGFDSAGPFYDIEVDSSASQLTITTD
ncbi:MAG: MarR family transcriptional regulator [Anaerolineaceae bacterium]|nr:MarR family transcriptional regulator [Anaerolineaceae bacterium]